MHIAAMKKKAANIYLNHRGKRNTWKEELGKYFAIIPVLIYTGEIDAGLRDVDYFREINFDEIIELK